MEPRSSRKLRHVTQRVKDYLQARRECGALFQARGKGDVQALPLGRDPDCSGRTISMRGRPVQLTKAKAKVGEFGHT